MRILTLIAVLLIAGPAAAELRFHTVTPCRIIDKEVVTAGESRLFPIKGHCSIPPDAKAVVVSVAVTDSDDGNGAYILIYDSGVPRPPTATLNWQTTLPLGRAVANNAIIRLESSNHVRVYAALDPTRSARVIVDVAGYFR